MILLWNKKHGKIITVWMGIFLVARSAHSAVLVIWPLTMLKEPNLASYPLLGLLHKEAQGCILYFCLPNLRSDKSNAESKHIYCSFISIHYQHDPPCETDAKPQFTFKILSFEVSNDLHTHSLGHTIIENQLGNLPPLQTWA